MSSPLDSAAGAGDVVDRLAACFSNEGSAGYLGEDIDENYITLSAHMIQSALRAERGGAPDTMVAAALLHDIGYFADVLTTAGPMIADDRAHEEVAALFLAPFFGPDVIEPVRLHVPAKRYLCVVEADYHDCLSEASVQSLVHQGGPMSDAECRAFEASPHHEHAVQIRRYDDEGKLPRLEIPNFDHFRELLHGLRTDR